MSLEHYQESPIEDAPEDYQPSKNTTESTDPDMPEIILRKRFVDDSSSAENSSLTSSESLSDNPAAGDDAEQGENEAPGKSISETDPSLQEIFDNEQRT